MRNRIFVLLILLVGFHSFSFAQLSFVEDEDLKEELFEFLIDQNQISVLEIERFTPSIVLVSALDYSAFDSTKTGIFKFVIFGSHQRPFLLIYEDQKIQLIKDYSVQNILDVLNGFFSRNESLFTNKQKLQYLENIVEIIKTNYNPPGWIRLEDGDLDEY